MSIAGQGDIVADSSVTNFATTTQAQKLTASDAANNDFFGNVVDIDGDYAAVGARGNKAVYVYYYNGSTWSEQTKIQQTAFGSNFGHAVSIVGDTLLVGSNNTDGSNADGTKEKQTFPAQIWMKNDTSVKRKRSTKSTGKDSFKSRFSDSKRKRR